MENPIDHSHYKSPAQSYGNDMPRTLPNAAATLVLGIISIATFCFYGVPGLVCGIIALSLYRKDKRLYRQDPGGYEQSFRNSSAGYVCAIIGVSLSGIMMLGVLIAIMSHMLR